MHDGSPDSANRHAAFFVLRSAFAAPVRRSLLCLALLAGLALGCSTKEPRYPADHARYQKIAAAVEGLQKAYAGRDLSAFRALLLPSGLLDRVETDVAKDFESYEEIALEFSIERVAIDGEAIDVFVHWQGKWKKKDDEAGYLDRGHGMLRFAGVQSILLKSVEGDQPFGMEARRALAESQKKGSP